MGPKKTGGTRPDGPRPGWAKNLARRTAGGDLEHVDADNFFGDERDDVTRYAGDFADFAPCG